MTNEDRIMYRKAINVLTNKYILRYCVESLPGFDQLEAMRLAIHAMNMMSYDTGKDVARKVAILKYHVDYPNALLFRDKHTMDAVKAGVEAMKYMLEG